jgi:hypothetical protein
VLPDRKGGGFDGWEEGEGFGRFLLFARTRGMAALRPWWWSAAAVLVLAAVAAAAAAAGGGDGDGERRALMAVKAGFGNAANALVDWDGGRDHCAWRGVACDSASFAVVGLCVHSSSISPPPFASWFLAAACVRGGARETPLALLPAFLAPRGLLCFRHCF